MDTDKIYAEHIANQYAPKDTSKVVALRKLDRKAKMPASIAAYTIGVIAALLLGIGMCLTMGVLGNGNTTLFVVGIIVGIIGIAGICINYPLYKKIQAKGKEKYASDIMELAREITE